MRIDNINGSKVLELISYFGITYNLHTLVKLKKLRITKTKKLQLTQD